MRNSLPFLVGVATAMCVSDSNAAVTAVFQNAGGLYDGLSMAQVSLVDSDSGVTFDMFVNASGGTLNSNSTGLGIGDAKLNTGETLSISFSVDARIDSIDFGEIGADSGDGVTVMIDSEPSFDLYTGQPDFNGISDVWTPSTGRLLTAGQSISFTTSSAGAVVDFDSLTVSVSAIPEPSTAMLCGLGCIGLLMRRKRDVAAI